MLLGSRNYFVTILVIGFLMLAYQFGRGGFSAISNHDEFVKPDDPISVNEISRNPDIENSIERSALPGVENSLNRQLGNARKPRLDNSRAKSNNSS